MAASSSSSSSSFSSSSSSNALKSVLYWGKEDEEFEKVQNILLKEFSCFSFQFVKTEEEGTEIVLRKRPDIVICKLGGLRFLTKVKDLSQTTFGVILSFTAARKAAIRQKAFDKGANMVTSDLHSLRDVLQKISQVTGQGSYTCPWCGMKDLTEDDLWVHGPLYHIAVPNNSLHCPICRKDRYPYQVHLRNHHGPVSRGEILSESHHDVSLYAFALIIVRHPKTGKFLLTQEFADVGWWIPGGRVDAGEDLVLAAIRETKEEGGIDIKITGIYQIEWNPREKFVRMRVIFHGEPVDERQIPKSIPDYESTGAAWVDVEEIETLPVRGGEVKWCRKVAENKVQLHPLSILAVKRS